MSYDVFVYNSSEPKNVAKVFSNVDSVINLFCYIIQSKFNCFETNYEVAFLRCLCELSNIERKQIIYLLQKLQQTGRRRREIYISMDPEKK